MVPSDLVEADGDDGEAGAAAAVDCEPAESNAFKSDSVGDSSIRAAAA